MVSQTMVTTIGGPLDQSVSTIITSMVIDTLAPPSQMLGVKRDSCWMLPIKVSKAYLSLIP